MEDEIILNRPSDRRLLGEDSDLTPGPPGTENDTFDMVQKGNKVSSQEKKSRRSPPSHSRRSPSSRNRRSTSRGRKSPSRNRETPNYVRDYSPPRRYGGTVRRRSRERVRSPDRIRKRSRERIERRRDRRERSRTAERYRPRRSRSQSVSPRSRRWSPKKKPASPPPPLPTISSTNPYAMPDYNDAYAAYPAQYAQQYTAPDYGAPPPPPAAFPSSYPPPPTWGMTIPPGEDYTAAGGWPAAPVPPPAQPVETDEEQMKRDAAVAQEVQNQRDQLKKQRNDYLKRAAALKREIKILKEQRNDLVSGGAPPSPTTKGFLEENDRLQSQIQKKLNTMENVIDMLSGIIGDEKPPTPPSPVTHKKPKKKKNESDDDSSPERLKTKVIESLKSKRVEGSKKEVVDTPTKTEPKMIKESVTPKKSEDTAKKINYTFYDPEMHWCQTCNVFPKTAKDYLNHLHSKEHLGSVKNPDTPWHEGLVNNEFPTYPNAPSKRAPIRGLQFFVPSTAWFCKLCNFWMGDLHCASVHLKSQIHSEKYNAYIDQNPHFEVDWMAERQKVYDMQRAPPPPPQITSVSTSGMDLLESIPLQINTQKKIDKLEKSEEIEKVSKKRKKKMEEKKEKKKKKRSKKRKKSSSSSSSSSSDSSSDSESLKKSEEDRANSIRVAMRNLSRSQEQLNILDGRGKWTTVQEGKVPEPVPPPPPQIVTAEAVEDRKKDELMISQWNTPQPIISESEKKLLEELKGKLKSKGPSEEKKKSSKNSEGPSKSIPKEIKKIDKDSPKSSRDAKEKEGRRSRSRTKKSPSVVTVEERDAEKRSRSRDELSKSRRRSLSKGRVVRRSASRGRAGRVRHSRSRDRRSRSRERRSRSRDRRSRSRVRRSRSRGIGRRSRSRDRRSRSRSRGGRRRRSRSVKRSRSYGRRRSYSRSRSRSSSHRIEKPIVRYPEFRPRVPENKKVSKVKTDEETERKKTPPAKKAPTSQPTGKKLPFIGRMPVFKKQSQGSDDKKDGENADPNQMDMHMGYDHFDGMMVDYDDLMPDPMQYVTLMGAPPPPPPADGPPEYDDDKDMLPPGVDETEADLVPKPISDAPIPRKGPLPKDFQEALNIIFPGEKKPDEEEAAEENRGETIPDEPDMQAPEETEVVQDSVAMEQMATATAVEDEASQMSIGEAFIGFPPANFSDHSQDVPDPLALVSAIPPPPPPPPPEEQGEDEKKFDNDSPKEMSEKKENSPTPSEKLRRQEELDDLAMLGIDADDLAAQCM